jgi:hypothetical protein
MFELENPNKEEMIEHIYKIADEYIQKSIDDPNGELAYQETEWRTPGNWFASIEDIEGWVKLITSHNNFYGYVTRELYKLGFYDEIGNEYSGSAFSRMWHGREGLAAKGEYGVTDVPINQLRIQRNKKRRAARGSTFRV